jgi:diguanylate cyclase (GGDEF) domain
MAKWVIVVDDDPSNLKMAGHILSKNNMKVTAFKSGRTMLNFIKENGTPDLILLDIKMPDLNGFETLHLLREQEKENDLPETPVIFLTADETTGTETRGFEVGVSDYIRKPFNPDVLIRRINNVISTQSEMISLKNEATIDKLTGFLNKAATTTELSKICTVKSGCLMMIDLDSFKLVNDIYGHEMGDKVLITFANIIRETVPQGSIYGRIGGDEFVSFCKNTSSEEQVAEITKQLNEKLVKAAKEMMGEDMSIPLGTSVGAIMVPKHGNDYASLLKLADKSLYLVKKNGKHGYALYSSDLFSDESENETVMDLKTLSEIMSERNMPNIALQLDMESFSSVFRYANRYFIRNNVNSCRILFTLDRPEGISDEVYMEACDEFGNHIRESLRKSDILTRNRFNQYFVLVTDIREEFTDKVIRQIIDTWTEKQGDTLQITYEAKFIRNDGVGPFEGGTADIAIVDDEPENLEMIENILSGTGLNISKFTSGEDFLDYTQTIDKVPDLILLDVKMPDMGGFEVMQKLKEIGGNISRTATIFLTADDGIDSEIEGLSLGAMDFIKKPFAPEVLKLRINHSLELVMLRKKYRKGKVQK